MAYIITLYVCRYMWTENGMQLKNRFIITGLRYIVFIHLFRGVDPNVENGVIIIRINTV